MNNRWALYIDILGFGDKWNLSDHTSMDGFKGINALMEGIFWIGDRHYRNLTDRLFAYQYGDGFLITSDSHEENLDRAVLIGIALLRHLPAQGETAKCSLSEGEISDIQNCYPREIRQQLNKQNIIFGHGVMTVTPVLGSALINCVQLEKKCPSGPMFAIALQNIGRLSNEFKTTAVSEHMAVINWLLGEPRGLNELQINSGLKQYSENERLQQLTNYIQTNSLKPEWQYNVRKYLFKN